MTRHDPSLSIPAHVPVLIAGGGPVGLMLSALHRQPGDVWRIDYQIRDDEDPAEAVKRSHLAPIFAERLHATRENIAYGPTARSSGRRPTLHSSSCARRC